MLDPKGRVAMVSGASRGIGRRIMERLLASGWQVSAGVRTPSGVAAAEGLLVHSYSAESAADAKGWAAATMARFGRIDALVNAAGIQTYGDLGTTTGPQGPCRARPVGGPVQGGDPLPGQGFLCVGHRVLQCLGFSVWTGARSGRGPGRDGFQL